jgi:hypothetical protein
MINRRRWCFGLSSPIAKNILVPIFLRNTLFLPSSRPKQGRIAIVTDAGWDAMDAARVARGHDMAGQDASLRACELRRVAQDERRVPRTVKSCGPAPDAGCKFRGGLVRPTGPDETFNPRDDGGNRAPPRGEHDIDRNTIACGNAGSSRCDCCEYSCAD